MSRGQPTHVSRPLDGGSRIWLSVESPKRLVVFVHGFLGNAGRTWKDIRREASGTWWSQSDMLMFGYDWSRDHVEEVADRLTRRLRSLSKAGRSSLEAAGEIRLPPAVGPYEEVVLVAHSLGGLIVRCAVASAAEDRTPFGFLLNAELRLFSPATAGFEPNGVAGVAWALGLRAPLSVCLAYCPAWPVLRQPPRSTLLVSVQERTQKAAGGAGSTCALRPAILWAQHDGIVAIENYDTDTRVGYAAGTNHRTVHRPTRAYDGQCAFIETGLLP